MKSAARTWQLVVKTGAPKGVMPGASRRIGRAALLVLGVLALGLPILVAGGLCSAAPMPVLTPAQYDQALASVSQAVRRQMDLEGTGNPVTGGVYPDQAVQPILHCQVRDPGGRWLVTVNNQPLEDAISNVESDSDSSQRLAGYNSILAQIALLRSNAGESSSLTTPGDVNASVRGVLSAPEFSSVPVPPPSKMEILLDRFWQWLGRMLRRFHGPSVPNVSVSPMVPRIILWSIVILAGGILLAYLISVISRRLAARGNLVVPESSLAMTAQEASLVATRDFDRLLALARSHAESRDHRSALRLVYLASLVFLDAEGIVRLNRSKTNWEYLRIVRSSGSENLYSALLPMTRMYDRIWYGVRQASAADYDAALAGHQEIRHILGAAAEPNAARPARATA